MKKQSIVFIAVVGLAILGGIQVSHGLWGIGKAIKKSYKRAKKTVRKKVIAPVHKSVTKPIYKKVLQPIGKGAEWLGKQAAAGWKAKKEAGKLLYDGGVMLEEAPGKIEPSLGQLYAMPNMLESGRDKIKLAVDGIGTALADVRKKKNDFRTNQRKQLDAFGLSSMGDDVEAAMSALEVALVTLAQIDKVGTCQKGVLCNYLKTAQNSKTVAVAGVEKIKQAFKELKDRLSKKYNCGLRKKKTLPDHMKQTGKDLAGNKLKK